MSSRPGLYRSAGSALAALAIALGFAILGAAVVVLAALILLWIF